MISEKPLRARSQRNLLRHFGQFSFSAVTFVQNWLGGSRCSGQYRQPHGYYRAFAAFTLHPDFAAVQIDAALDDYQTKTGARTVINVMSTMEGGEEPLSIGLRNPDTLVSDSADNFCFGIPHFESHHLAEL